MTLCPRCGSSARSGAGYCPSCGEIFAPSIKMPPLDPMNFEFCDISDRVESLPPLFDQAEQVCEKSAQHPGTFLGEEQHALRHGAKSRNIFLLAIIVLVIASAAVVAVYVLLPEFKGAERDPVFYLGGGLLYMQRGDRAADSCLVHDLSAQIRSAEELHGGAREAAERLFETFFYDKDNQTLYFMDFQDNLYLVAINKLGFGKTDIQDRVKLIAQKVISLPGDENNLLREGYSVLSKTNQVFYLRSTGDKKQFCEYTVEGVRVLSDDAEAYRVSKAGESALFLRANSEPADRNEYTMYICSTKDGGLVKVDSRVGSVKKLDDTFDLVWYTRYDPENAEGPVSVWIGGKSLDNERVLNNLVKCEGFSERGFYYAVQTTLTLNVWDYIGDVDPGDGTYGSYSTLRSVLKSSTFERTSQTVSFWNESGSNELARGVDSWEVLDAEKGLLAMRICDYSPEERLGIEEIKSAFSAIEYLEKAVNFTNSYFSYGGGAAFKGEGLIYCCIDPEGSELWMIDKSDGRGVLYSCAVSENGFINRKRLASDIFAAAYWQENGSLIFAGDYNDSTKRCDLYTLKEGVINCVSYEVYLPGWEAQLFDSGAALAYLKEPLFSSDSVKASLYYYSGGESFPLAQDVRDFAIASYDRVFYLSGGAEGAAELFLYNGSHELIAEGVSAVFAPGTQTRLRLAGS